MPINELVAEGCKVDRAGDESFQEMMANLEVRRGPLPYPNAKANVEQCNGQRDRIMRVIKAKGIPGKLPDLCKQQARGQAIVAPNESISGSPAS